MRYTIIATVALLLACYVSYAKTYNSKGERIYKTGKNDAGKVLLDKGRSQITIFKSCQGCHGASGTRVSKCNIKWSYLTDSSHMAVPYTRELFYRFLDQDRKSDGSEAETGVHWQMSKEEKDDLITYLQQL